MASDIQDVWSAIEDNARDAMADAFDEVLDELDSSVWEAVESGEEDAVSNSEFDAETEPADTEREEYFRAGYQAALECLREAQESAMSTAKYRG